MRNLIYIFLLLISYTVYSQSLSLFNVDATAFPLVQANFYAFDASGNQTTNFSKSDFSVIENGQPRTITNLVCNEPTLPQDISSVLVLDVSGSMCGLGLLIEKAAANAWINLLSLGKSDCAITSFSDLTYINQDFTTNRAKLVHAIDNLKCLGGTDYNRAMLDAMAGGVQISQKGKHKRVIVFMSDGGMNFEPDTAKIISDANNNNISVYCVIIGTSAPRCLKVFSKRTGGLYFENIQTKEEAEECFRKIFISAQGGNPCSIEWMSGFSCQSAWRFVTVKLSTLGLVGNTSYQSPYYSSGKLEFTPPSLKFLKAVKDTCLTLKIIAKNSDFIISNIIVSNPAFRIHSPKNFTLKSGESRDLDVCYTPADSGLTYCKFTFENDLCPVYYYASGGFPGKKPKTQTLKLIQPNGGESFVVGMDTVITWEGVLPEDSVKIEYTIDKGLNWLPIADSVTGLSYQWKIPKTPSSECLARVTAKVKFDSVTTDTIPDPDPETDSVKIQICNQIWMKHNLTVDHYRNGDKIPEVTDPSKWKDLTSGAWCYYNNDPANNRLYGKLYNWYAVNDPRGLAPDGWHIASLNEWDDLEKCLGGSSVAGGKLKSIGTKEGGDGLWYSPNKGATNESGFNALPGGWLNADSGIFSALGYTSTFWTFTESGSMVAWSKGLYQNGAYISQSVKNKNWGFSVRCIRD